MKTILILTDFSENATHAAFSATILVEGLRSNVLLYHTYYNSPVLTAYAGGAIVISEFALLKEQSLSKLNRLASKLRRNIIEISALEFNSVIDYQCGEGPLGSNVSEIIKEKDIELIVMGASSDGKIHHLCYGSDTFSAISSSSCPVLVIPPKAQMNKIRKVTLATAFELADINAINYLVELSRVFDYQLEIVHVSLREETENLAKRNAVHCYIDLIKQANVSYHEVRGKDVINRLNNFCKENGSDILALVHFEHGFFDSILNRSHAGEALLNHHIPLMIIPAKTERQK